MAMLSSHYAGCEVEQDRLRVGRSLLQRSGRNAGAVLALCTTLAFPLHAQVPAAAPPADAAPVEGEQALPPVMGLTGDWNGRRTRLADAGITLTPKYVAEGAYNVRGGARSVYRTANEASLVMALELNRLVGIRGGKIQLHLTQRHGQNLGVAAGFPFLLPVQEKSGRGNVTRLTALWWQQQVSARLLVKLGRLMVSDFGTFSCDFMNLAFCGAQMPNVANDYILAFPISQWGGWLRYGSPTRACVQVGAYQVTPKNRNPNSAFEVGSFDEATGVLLPLEVALFPRLGRRRLPGSIKLGGWYETSTVDDVLLNENRVPRALAGGRPLRRTGRHGGYLALKQEVLRLAADTRPVTLFFNLTRADTKATPNDYQLGTGLFVQGIFAARPTDNLGLAYAVTRANPRAAQAQALLDPESARRSERVLECFYGAQLLGGVLLQPGVQFVSQPGGLRTERNILILDLKTVLTF